MSADCQEIYDDFSGPELDKRKWIPAAVPLGEGKFWTYQEPNAIVKTAGGRLEITVNPFTRKNDQVQIFDNPKHLYASTYKFSTPPGTIAIFECDMAATAYNAVPGDIYDAFVAFNLFDFDTGMVLDFCNKRKGCHNI